MAYLEELLPEFRKGAKIRMKDWPKPFYYEMKNRKVYNQDGHRVKNFSHQALFKNVWEFYKEPEPDWQYIIEHKCLCWFWDENYEEHKFINVLLDMRDSKYPFITENSDIKIGFSCCLPVCRDEATFYEDRDDKK